MHVFSGNGQVLEMRQNMSADRFQFGGIARSDVKNLLLSSHGKRVQPHGEDTNFPG